MILQGVRFLRSFFEPLRTQQQDLFFSFRGTVLKFFRDLFLLSRVLPFSELNLTTWPLLDHVSCETNPFDGA